MLIKTAGDQHTHTTTGLNGVQTKICFFHQRDYPYTLILRIPSIYTPTRDQLKFISGYKVSN